MPVISMDVEILNLELLDYLLSFQSSSIVVRFQNCYKRPHRLLWIFADNCNNYLDQDTTDNLVLMRNAR